MPHFALRETERTPGWWVDSGAIGRVDPEIATASSVEVDKKSNSPLTLVCCLPHSLLHRNGPLTL
jgi:hypothetical protein